MTDAQNSTPSISLPPSTPKHFPIWLAVLLLVIVGALAGLVSSILLLFSGPIKIPWLRNSNLAAYLPQKEITLETVREVTVNPDVQINEVVKTLAPQIVTIYRAKTGGTDILKQIYGPQDVAARGFVLSADGWLVTVSKALPGVDNLRLTPGAIAKITPKNIAAKLADLRVAVGSQPLATPSKALFDPLTGLVFLKIDATNLTSAKLGVKDTSTLGQDLLILNSAQVSRASLKAFSDQNIDAPLDLLRSPEVFNNFIALNRVDSWQSGSLVVDLSGAVLGLVEGDKIIPTLYLRQPVNQVLKNGASLVSGSYLGRPFSGLRYLDLHEQKGITATAYKDIQAGALIYSRPASGSPAALAGLKDGDVILKINDDRLNGRLSLSEYIWDYAPATELDLLVLRAGQEEKIKLTLGAWTVK